jgi:hypothetical protein
MKHLLFLSDFTGTCVFSIHFEEFSNTKFHEDPSSGSRIVHENGRTERHDGVKSRFSQFWERAEELNAGVCSEVPVGCLKSHNND